MPKWTEYTSKDTLADNDEVMLYDATGKANKRGLMSKFWNYVVDKMSTAVISKLETNNKTIIGAINALNSETPRYKNANYRGFSDIITALNAEKDSFSTATSYILTANLVGGAPHLIVFGIDDTGYGAGLYINYAGKISFFKIEKGSFYNFKM
jgi:hypothetical protein